jgi:hypothetical protein
MNVLLIAIVAFIALISFLGGFILGVNFAKAYLWANDLLQDKPNPVQNQGCGKENCDCRKA